MLGPSVIGGVRPQFIPELSDALLVRIAYGTCIVRRDRTVACVGTIHDHYEEQKGDHYEALKGVVDLELGDNACALRDDQKIACMGTNDYGTLLDGTTKDRFWPIVADGLEGVAQIAPGDESICARLVDGSVVCWGNGDRGQLGNGSLDASAVPVPVAGLPPAIDLRAGQWPTYCAITVDREVWCWGDNNGGQLGGGSFIGLVRPTPGPVVGLQDVRGLAVGLTHACAVTGGDHLYCWGFASAGVGDGTEEQRDEPVEVFWR